jgi:hypothetical protein
MKAMKQFTIKVHEIAVDGLPQRDQDGSLTECLVGRVAFLFDGNIVNGWPLDRDGLWEANSDVGHGRPFVGVTHWVEFPLPLWEMEKQK